MLEVRTRELSMQQRHAVAELFLKHLHTLGPVYMRGELDKDGPGPFSLDAVRTSLAGQLRRSSDSGLPLDADLIEILPKLSNEVVSILVFDGQNREVFSATDAASTLSITLFDEESLDQIRRCLTQLGVSEKWLDEVVLD